MHTYKYAVAIGPVTKHPFPVAIGSAICHVQTCHSRGAKVTVSVVAPQRGSRSNVLLILLLWAEQ